MSAEVNGDVRITVCPDGPLLVRGAIELVDADGAPVDIQRNVVALCRCGGTRNPPFCDSTHKKKKPRRAVRTAARAEEGGEP
ncbi:MULTISPECIES: CDGSH iron-sulfur domain-containing protein [Prescottella]|jgi:CDGSH-type Zn-finger protein|nr:CDGSH iron-sulfur domain-containing protein [Prescottella equi]MBU4613786.1 CDGSH iron-sulfur domain-containing protein [Rhodococcus sp. GG48]MCD7049903.1 CDGSH iron-sulfur domain-containing protein [Rhodococcus sp. BH2-1]GBF13547.1 iron-binding zinc finger CDGSH type [Rhodococcus sp. Br-6]MBM4476937.1 CDGSH iron-sulfur domain-containing protein [Prescottella equi]MBM4485014.1 CDGSH iron-sulfur domain-containing protein [Prescottella equi]